MKKIILFAISLVLIIALISYNYVEIQKTIESFANWAYPSNKDRNGEIIKLILNIAAGIVIIIGLYATIIRATATQKSVEKQGESIENQSHQIELTRKSQINEQFKNAIEHLGSEKEPIILGGISELHQIASEENSEFKDVVFNILCSYIRSIAKKDKHAEKINYTIVQTILNYLFKTDVYKNLSPDLRNTNLISVNIDDIKFENAKFNFCFLPFKMSNTQFIDCDLSSTSSFGRFKNILIKNCDLFNFNTYSSKFDNLELINENGKNYSLIFLNTELKNSKIKTDLYKNEFIACEFETCEFKAESFLNTNFFGSSFDNVNFDIKEISGGNFKACGFDKTKITSSIFDTSFDGSDNEKQYFIHFLDRRIENRIDKDVNTNGLNLQNSTMMKCTFDPLNLNEGNKLIEYYEKLEEKYNSRESRKK